MLAPPTIDDLAEFSGRSVDTYGEFATSALKQATLLFQIITHLPAYPNDPDLATLARTAIVQLADKLYLEQGYAEDIASPFQSETIGSYSYSKSVTYQNARDGLSTGLIWWDLALEELTWLGFSMIGSGSIGGFDNELGVNLDTGRRGIPSPLGEADLPPYGRIS